MGPHHRLKLKKDLTTLLLTIILCTYLAGSRMGEMYPQIHRRPRYLKQTQLEALAGVNSAIFFLETNSSLSSFWLQPECAFESAAAKNPDRPVIVVINASSRMSGFGEHLANLSNLHLFKVDFQDLTDGTLLKVRHK